VARSWLAVLALSLAAAAWAEQPPEPAPKAPFAWSFGGELTLRPDRSSGEAGLFDQLNTSLAYRYRFFEAVMDFALARDERYVPDEPYTLGRSFFLQNGGLVLDFDCLRFTAGRFVHHDTVEGPYSLFISAADHWGSGWAHGLPALLADLTVHGGPFTYESRWVRLNANAFQPILPGGPSYPDRGANYKVFALELGHWRFGLQDAAVYFGRQFDPEYFLSPIPSILTQMVTKRDSTPWEEDANDNSIIGLFAEWRPPRGYLYAQWLVDDISLDFLIPWFLRDDFGHPRVANKWAWSLGGHWDFPFGRLGFYHAGATKFTFEATEDDKPYGYTYYPAVEYSLDDDTSTFEAVLDPQDNYLGYKYGENNLAFRLELSHLSRPLLGADLKAALEYVLSGSKSPANPWHEFTTADSAGRYTQMLDDPVLEHTVVGEVAAAWPWRGWTFYTRLRLGGVFNRLELAPAGGSAASDGMPRIYRPQPGENAFLYAWTVGFCWRTGWRRSQAAPAPGAAGKEGGGLDLGPSQEPESPR
jgi:hypothetical protein